MNSVELTGESWESGGFGGTHHLGSDVGGMGLWWLSEERNLTCIPIVENLTGHSFDIGDTSLFKINNEIKVVIDSVWNKDDWMWK